MRISTNLSAAPYFDDYNDQKDFYRILFKPGYPVQTRELNQLQTILQKQIERFGDNIFKSGTIIDGCNFTLHDTLPYVKIRDFQTDGMAADVEDYKGLYVRNSSNLAAYVVEAVNGFETSAPDLNTLYLKYINSGASKADASFSANQMLTVYDPANPIFSIQISNGSIGFSNSDILIITPTVRVANSTGGNAFGNNFYVGDYIQNGLGANVQITEISYIDDQVYLTYKPQANNLITGNTVTWTISANDSIVDSNTAEHAVVREIIGDGLSAKLTTDTVGKISDIVITSSGSGYVVSPKISVYSSTANAAQISAANLVPINYKAKITVANNSVDPIGSGYGVTVSEGVIYQKGYFLRVQNQLAIVSKYTQPDDVVLGFSTFEDTIDSNDDTSLLDNALGSPNETAPGADRLKLVPYLSTISKKEATSNSEFLSLIEFTNGYPYKQTTQTQYDIIEEAVAKRTAESDGNFVIDDFMATTISENTMAEEANSFRTIVDTGIAYINGYRVETVDKYSGRTAKGTFENVTKGNVSTNFGNYVRVQKFGGRLPFFGSGMVELSGSVNSWAGNGALSSPGNIIGYARTRSVVAEDQTAGIYRVYLFDIRMNAGKNFSDVKSIYNNSAANGCANLILESGKAVLKDSNYNGLLFKTGVDAVKSVANVSYKYRAGFLDTIANTSGYVSKTLSGDEIFPYTGTLSTANELDIVLIARANIKATSNLNGSITVSSGANTITGTGTNFLTSVTQGDWLYVGNSTANAIVQVSSVNSDTSIGITVNAPAAYSGNAAYYYPANHPINLQSGIRTANVSSDNKVLTVYLGSGINSAGIDIIADVQVDNVTPQTKTLNRQRFVRIDLSNNSAGISGPWCLGVSDIFRLRNVYLGSNNSFDANSAGVENITNDFYIDHNQEVDFLNLGYLVKDPMSSRGMQNSDRLLIEFDAFSGAEGGLYYKNSYVVNDGLDLADLGTAVNTMEIPEVWSSKDEYYDLRDCFDARPRAVNTANLALTSSVATVNPIEPAQANLLSNTDKKYPSPNGTISYVATYYSGRKDLVVIDEQGTINVVEGDIDGEEPQRPDNCMVIDKLNIPAYPSIPNSVAAEYAKIIDTKVANEKYSNARLKKYSIASYITAQEKVDEQPKVYTMEDIGRLDRRLSDVEYYVSFTMQEAYAANKSIASRTDSAIERFKFGYFVDPFDDNRYSDYNNPAFKAEFRNGRLVPYSNKLNIVLKDVGTDYVGTDRILPPFEEVSIIRQPYATELRPVSNVSTPVSNTDVTVYIQKTIVQMVDNQNNYYDSLGRVSESSDFTMSRTAGLVEMFFNFRDRKYAIEVYQSQTPNFSLADMTPIRTAQNAVPLTNDDRIYKTTDLIGKYESLTTHGYQGISPKFVVEDAGKLVWNHNPAQGRYYRIVITKYGKSGDANWGRGEFHYKLYYPSDSEQTISVPSTLTVINATTGETSTNIIKSGSVGEGVVTSFAYVGILKPDVEYLTSAIRSVLSLGWYSTNLYMPQSVGLKTTGLKPGTQHKLYLDGVDVTQYCTFNKQSNLEWITSDGAGKVDFIYLYRASDLITSSFTLTNLYNYYATKQSFNLLLKSADGSSQALGTIKAS